MATSGDRYLATSGDFFMATDSWCLPVNRLIGTYITASGTAGVLASEVARA